MGWVRLAPRSVEVGARQRAAALRAHGPIASAWLALACGVLVSCGGEPILAPPLHPSPELTIERPPRAAATPESGTPSSPIGPVVWAAATDPNSMAPREPVASFQPDAPRIIAAVQTRGLVAGSIVEATWEYNDTSLDMFTTRLELPDSGGDRWLSFSVSRDPEVPWPDGIYEVTIALDGIVVQQSTVEVRGNS